MALMFHMTKNVLKISAIFLLIPGFAIGQESQSIYFAGYVRHFEPKPETHEGNMSYLGYSKEYRSDNWRFEPGIATAIDSYSLRSYSVFVDISHNNFQFSYVRPMLSLNCMYKGSSYDHKNMSLQCYPFVKFRVGGDKFFANITPVPQVKGVTNGLIAIEFGYRWQ